MNLKLPLRTPLRHGKTAILEIMHRGRRPHRMKFVVINKEANSLYSLIADGKYRATSLGRNTWKSLIGSQASLQTACIKEGFNAMCSITSSSKARIDILGNNQGICSSYDSRIGFGTGGLRDDSNTCGNLLHIAQTMETST